MNRSSTTLAISLLVATHVGAGSLERSVQANTPPRMAGSACPGTPGVTHQLPANAPRYSGFSHFPKTAVGTSTVSVPTA